MKDESIHFYTCALCGQPVDCRDLAHVFHHEHSDLSEPPEGIAARRTGDPEEWTNGKKIDLN